MNRPRSRPGPRGNFADRLRAAREARGLTQEQAATELGIARETLARWESGSSKPGGIAHRYVGDWIARALGEEEDNVA